MDAEVLVVARAQSGQAGGVGLGHRVADHAGAGRGHPEAGVRDRPGRLPQHDRPGLQGQRRLPGPLRRRGDAHRHHDGPRSHRRRALPAGQPQEAERDRPNARVEQGSDPRRDHARRRDAAVGQPGRQQDRQHHRQHRGQDHARDPGARPGEGSSQAARRRVHHAHPRRRDPSVGAELRQPCLGQVPALRQPAPHSHRAPPVLPRPAAHVDHHAAPGQRLDRPGGQGLGLHDREDGQPHLPRTRRSRPPVPPHC